MFEYEIMNNGLENRVTELEKRTLAITPRQGLDEYKKGYAKAEEDLKGKLMSKEQALRILKLLSGLEMYVFMQTDVPDYHQDEIIKVIGDLTDYVLEKENEN